MYRSAISGQAVTPDFAYSHPRTTEADSIDYPSIKNRPTRILHRRVDTGEIVTAAFAALFPDITVREVVPVYSLFD